MNPIQMKENIESIIKNHTLKSKIAHFTKEKYASLMLDVKTKKKNLVSTIG